MPDGIVVTSDSCSLRGTARRILHGCPGHVARAAVQSCMVGATMSYDLMRRVPELLEFTVASACRSLRQRVDRNTPLRAWRDAQLKITSTLDWAPGRLAGGKPRPFGTFVTARSDDPNPSRSHMVS